MEHQVYNTSFLQQQQKQHDDHALHPINLQQILVRKKTSPSHHVFATAAMRHLASVYLPSWVVLANLPVQYLSQVLSNFFALSPPKEKIQPFCSPLVVFLNNLLLVKHIDRSTLRVHLHELNRIQKLISTEIEKPKKQPDGRSGTDQLLFSLEQLSRALKELFPEYDDNVSTQKRSSGNPKGDPSSTDLSKELDSSSRTVPSHNDSPIPETDSSLIQKPSKLQPSRSPRVKKQRAIALNESNVDVDLPLEKVNDADAQVDVDDDDDTHVDVKIQVNPIEDEGFDLHQEHPISEFKKQFRKPMLKNCHFHICEGKYAGKIGCLSTFNGSNTMFLVDGVLVYLTNTTRVKYSTPGESPMTTH